MTSLKLLGLMVLGLLLVSGPVPGVLAGDDDAGAKWDTGLKWDAAKKHLVVQDVPDLWARLGVTPGDRIVKINGQSLKSREHAVGLFKLKEVNKLLIDRDGWENETTVPGVEDIIDGIKVSPGERPAQGPEKVDEIIKKLKKAGFTDAQIEVLLEIFEVKKDLPEEEPQIDPEEKALRDAGLSEQQAKALLKLFRKKGEEPDAEPKPDVEPKPAPEMSALDKAIEEALARGVKREVIDRLVNIGEKLDWSEEKLIEHINKLKGTGSGPDGEVPEQPAEPKETPPPDKPEESEGDSEKESEFSPELQAAIKRNAERTGASEMFFVMVVNLMKKQGKTDEEIIKMLDTIKITGPGEKPPGKQD
ncbi:MAG: hypothetical protein ABIH04_00810 [Planctomycetota bacterium]